MDTTVERKYTICVSTTKPSKSLTPGGGGGSITTLCPYTGSILSTLRTAGSENSNKSLLGVSSLSKFPTKFSNQSNATNTVLMAYGGSSRKDDTYGMLLSLRKSPLSPLLHWKCRLPEPKFTAGISVSPCGHFIAGGGSSGTCYVWSALGGALLRTVKAHYRSVNKLAWSDCGAYLVTGGADGIIHVYSLLDLVDRETSDAQTVAPIRTWSFHDLGVTALTTLPGGRMASSADDQRVVVFEIYSDSILATLQMRHTCNTLAFHEGRLYAGAIQGSIYIIDLDLHAMQQSSQLGGTVVSRRPMEKTNEDCIFGPEYEYDIKTELHGHSKAVTCVAVFKDEDKDMLVSGDESGVIRIWDAQARVCVRIIEPWAHAVQNTSTSTETDKSLSSILPVTDILVVPRDDDNEQQLSSSLGSFGTGGANRDSKSQSTVVNQITPLQKFAGGLMDTANSDGNSVVFTPVPFLKESRDEATATYWDTTLDIRYETKDVKKELAPGQETSVSSMAMDIEENVASKNGDSSMELETQKQEILLLQKQLEEAKSTIQRWETVNNKLLSKLK